MKSPGPKNKPLTAFVGLGSNLGQRDSSILKAISMIRNLPKVGLVSLSSIYETRPVGPVEQDDFLNAIIQVEIEMLPTCFLLYLQDIEIKLGRVRNKRWGPRTIDLDLVAVGSFVCHTDNLILPHPEMDNREFVLVPMNEIAPEFKVPGTGKSIGSLLEMQSDKNGTSLFMASAGVWKMLKEV